MIPQAGYHKDYFSLYTGKPNREIVVARRLGDEWIFAGAIPPSVYDVGQVPMYSVAWVRHDFDDDGQLDEIKIPIRRQGSVYRWDRSVQPPTFQLDTWHEPWHPWYWDRGFHFEAEVYDGLTAGSSHGWSVYTDAPFAPDYTNFTTLLEVSPSDDTSWNDFNDAPSVRYEFAPRVTTDLYVWVRARMKNDATGLLKIAFDENSSAPQEGVLEVVGEEWQWLSVDRDSNALLTFFDVAPAQHMEPEDGSAHFDLRHDVTLRPSSAQIEVDRFILSDDVNFRPESLTPPQEVLEVGTHFPQALQEGLLWHLNSELEVAVDGDERVLSWGDVRDPSRVLTSTDGPVRSLDEDGKALMTFESAQSLVGVLGEDLTEATLMMRVRLSELQLDTAYLYALGHDGVEGGAMTFAHSATDWGMQRPRACIGMAPMLMPEHRFIRTVLLR